MSDAEKITTTPEDKARAIGHMKQVCRYYLKRANANGYTGNVRDGIAVEFLMGAATMAKVLEDKITAGVLASFAANVVGSPHGGSTAVEMCASLQATTPEGLIAEVEARKNEAASGLGLTPEQADKLVDRVQKVEAGVRVIRVGFSKSHIIAFLLGAVISAFICQYI